MSKCASTLAVMALLALVCCGKGESDSYRSKLCWGTRHALGTTGARGDVDAAMKALEGADASQSCARYNQLLFSARSLIKGFQLGVSAWNDRPEVSAVSEALRIRDSHWTRSVEEELRGLVLECADRLVEVPEAKRRETAMSLRQVAVRLDAAVASCPVDMRPLDPTSANS